MATAASTTGYMRKYKAVSRQAATATYSATNISTITLTALEAYIRAYFDTTGKHRSLLQQFAPGVMHYVSDVTFAQGSDATKTFLTIERYNERIAAHPPCIILNDSGVVLKSVGFGRSVAQDRQQRNLTSHHISVSREVPVTFLVVANSKSDLATLSQTLHTIFFDLSNFTSGRLIHATNETDTWLIRLPMVMDAGNYDKSNQSDDPQMQIWSSTMSFVCSFEDSFMLAGDDINYDAGTDAIDPPNIGFPETMRVGKKYIGTISNLLVTMKAAISDPNIASIGPGSSPFEYIITAKKPGVFSVKIFDGARTEDKYAGQNNMLQPNVILEKQITVGF